MIPRQNKERNYIWISIEGTDGTGKTTLSNNLYDYLQSRYSDKNFFLLSEFSNSVIGKLIKRVIRERNFLQIKDSSHYSLTETLILFADLFYQFEENVLTQSNLENKENIYLISDRGPVSFLTYQLLRIEDQYLKQRTFYQTYIISQKVIIFQQI